MQYMNLMPYSESTLFDDDMNTQVDVIMEGIQHDEKWLGQQKTAKAFKIRLGVEKQRKQI